MHFETVSNCAYMPCYVANCKSTTKVAVICLSTCTHLAEETHATASSVPPRHSVKLLRSRADNVGRIYARQVFLVGIPCKERDVGKVKEQLSTGPLGQATSSKNSPVTSFTLSPNVWPNFSVHSETFSWTKALAGAR